MASASPVIPHLTVLGGTAALAFYEKAFGAKLDQKMMAKDGERVMHASFTINGGLLMLNDDFPEFGAAGGSAAPLKSGGSPVTIHLEVPDADVAWQRAVTAGAVEVMPLANQFWGARYGKLKDPFGHVWSIGGPVK